MASETESHEYQSDFYDYINAGSLASARVICPLIVGWLRPSSVLDVGCGAGAWCKIWAQSGVSEVLGVDGAYVSTASLLIPKESFRSQDLSQAFDYGRKFALVTSLEVAEHIPEASARMFAENLARHGDAILFSAAVPGQGGEFHVNEQPLSYWQQQFLALGFRCFDPLRPKLVGMKQVEPWYRYNTLLYVRGAAAAELPAEVLATELVGGAQPPEVAPLQWRLRNAVIRALPSGVVRSLVAAKHRWMRQGAAS